MFARNRRLWIIGGAAIAIALAAGGAGIAVATGVGDDDQPLTGTALEQAVDAALAHTGPGTVIETEVGDGGAAYSVEVQLDADGSQVEVNLDASFNVIGQETDDDGTGDHQDED